MTKSVKSSLRAITRNRLAIGAAEREAVPKLSVVPLPYQRLFRFRGCHLSSRAALWRN
jgi:hypothetical protein